LEKNCILDDTMTIMTQTNTGMDVIWKVTDKELYKWKGSRIQKNGYLELGTAVTL
jgi:hypothetical protein